MKCRDYIFVFFEFPSPVCSTAVVEKSIIHFRLFTADLLSMAFATLLRAFARPLLEAIVQRDVAGKMRSKSLLKELN